MADLHNLLGDLDDDNLLDGNLEQVRDEPDEPLVDDAEEFNRLTPEVPPALAEAAAKRNESKYPSIDKEFSSGDSGEYDGDDFAFDKNISQENTVDDVDEEGLEDVDYIELKRLWKQELNCPELCYNDSGRVDLFMELLQGQEETIEKLLDQASSNSSRNGSRSSRMDPNIASLVASIYKMDADRVRFMITDLARTRLTKIEQHALYMRTMVDRMSEHEVSYLKQYGELLERHLSRSVLDHLKKDAWKKLDEPEMIDSPDLDEFVFCKVLETIEIDNRDTQAEIPRQDDDDNNDEIRDFEAGRMLIARYSAIKDLVLQGKIELVM